MKVLVPLVEGFEEIEAVTIVDILRRAGIETDTVSLVSSTVEGAHGIKMSADYRISEIKYEDYDALVLPGGDPGYKNMLNSSTIMSMVKFFDENKRLIGAICAAPIVLAKAGILENKKATVYPTLENNIPNFKDEEVVDDKNIVTAAGPGAAIPFVLKLVELIEGKEKADAIGTKIVFKTEVE